MKKHKNRQRSRQNKRKKKAPPPPSTKVERLPPLFRLRPGADGDPILEIPRESIPILQALTDAWKNSETRAKFLEEQRAVAAI